MSAYISAKKYCLFLQLIISLSAAFYFCPSAFCQSEVDDPWEPMNRKIFSFNEGFDEYIMEPAAKGYNYITPEFLQDGIGNFFSNLRFPKRLVSSLVQLKFQQALEQTGRFLVNTTLGVAGVMDVASEIGLKQEDDDFGVALGYHGVCEGPYLVIPFIGPSNLRDGLSLLVDLALDPLFFTSYIADGDSVRPITYGLAALDFVDTRNTLTEAIDTAKASSLDYYLFLQGAYHQHRQGLIHDGLLPEEGEENLFDKVPD